MFYSILTEEFSSMQVNVSQEEKLFFQTLKEVLLMIIAYNVLSSA